MSRCACCEYSAKFAAPTGPTDAEILCIGEKPGREEANRGLVFQGDSGLEIDLTYLPAAGLDRRDVRIVNCVWCRLGDSNDTPTQEQIDTCASHHLPREVQRCDPEVIILLGSTAATMLPFDIDLNKDHGIPIWVDAAEHERTRKFFGDWKGWIFPTFHPAAALHSTSMMIPLLSDFRQFRLWRQGKWKRPTDQFLWPVYQVLTEDFPQLELIRMLERSDYDWLPVDTEDDCGTPWSLQFSPQAGAGYLVPAEAKGLLLRLASLARDRFKGLVLHQAVHDLPVIEALGAGDRWKFRDTMQEAYHQGDLPQGLKALAWRLLGVKMQSWEDLVMPPSRELGVKWLVDAWDLSTELREEKLTMYKRPQKPGGKKQPGNPVWNEDRTKIVGKREWIASGLEKDLKRIIRHAPKPTYDIWGKAEEAGSGVLKAFEGVMGRMPRPSIANADPEAAVVYACRDADMEGRVMTALEERAKGLMEGEWKVAEEDYDG